MSNSSGSHLKANTRKYPEINIGDDVKVFQTQGAVDKRQVSTWSKYIYKMETITNIVGQNFNQLSDWAKPLLRHEI